MRQRSIALCTIAYIVVATSVDLSSELPDEPVKIGTEPQFFVDDFIVDNRFAIKYKNYSVTRQFHQPQKHTANPAPPGTPFAGVVDPSIFRR